MEGYWVLIFEESDGGSFVAQETDEAAEQLRMLLATGVGGQGQEYEFGFFAIVGIEGDTGRQNADRADEVMDARSPEMGKGKATAICGRCETFSIVDSLNDQVILIGAQSA